MFANETQACNSLAMHHKKNAVPGCVLLYLECMVGFREMIIYVGLCSGGRLSQS